MKKHLPVWLLIFSFFLLTGKETTAQRNWLAKSTTPQQLQNYFKSIERWRSNKKEAILKTIDELPDSIKVSIIKNAENQLSFDWPNLPATVFLQFSESGNRSHYEGIRRKRRTVLSALVLGELIEGKQRFMPQIINGIWAICEESTWAYPAHLSLQKKYTPLPYPGENIVDLGDGGTATIMAWTYFLL